MWVERRGERPVRVMVCHWSRTRPVLSTNGQSCDTTTESRGGAMATKRALRSLVKKPPSANRRSTGEIAGPQRPLERLEVLERLAARSSGPRDVEGARPFVLEAGEVRVLVEDLRGGAEGERIAIPQPARHLAQHPPVGPRIARQRQERALARDAALGVGDRAVLLAPGRSRQAHVRVLHRVVARDVLGDDEQLEPGERVPHRIGARQRYGRVGAHHPQRLDAAVGDGIEHVRRP